MTKLFFVRASINSERLVMETMEREVAKETEKQFKLGNRPKDAPCDSVVNKSNLGVLKGDILYGRYYYSYCLEADCKKVLKECALQLQKDLQNKYDAIAPLLEPMRVAKYPIKELK